MEHSGDSADLSFAACEGCVAGGTISILKVHVDGSVLRLKSVPSMTFLLYCPWMKSLLSDPTLFLHHMHCHLLVIIPTSFCLIPIPKVIRVHCLFACLLAMQAILYYTSLVGTSSATAVHISFLRLNQYSLFNEVSTFCFRKKSEIVLALVVVNLWVPAVLQLFFVFDDLGPPALLLLV